MIPARPPPGPSAALHLVPPTPPRGLPPAPHHVDVPPSPPLQRSKGPASARTRRPTCCCVAVRPSTRQETCAAPHNHLFTPPRPSRTPDPIHRPKYRAVSTGTPPPRPCEGPQCTAVGLRASCERRVDRCDARYGPTARARTHTGGAGRGSLLPPAAPLPSGAGSRAPTAHAGDTGPVPIFAKQGPQAPLQPAPTMPPERVPRNSSAENARAPHTPRVSAPPFPSGGAIVAARVSPGGRCGRISKSRRRARRQGAKALRPRCQRPAADPKADGCFEMGPRAVCQRADVWSGAAPGESAATCRLTGGSAGPGYILKGGLGTTTTPTALTRRRVAPQRRFMGVFPTRICPDRVRFGAERRSPSPFAFSRRSGRRRVLE